MELRDWQVGAQQVLAADVSAFGGAAAEAGRWAYRRI